MFRAFFIVDIVVGLLILLAILVLALTGRLRRFYGVLFVVGCIIGAMWEFPVHFLGPHYMDDPIYRQLTAFPLHPILQPALHCIWDGALFLSGVWLIERLTPPPHFERFRWRELSILMIWGASSALAIEFIGSFGGWVYVPYWWNPAIISLPNGAITLLPLVLWAVAAAGFYRLVLMVHSQLRLHRDS